MEPQQPIQSAISELQEGCPKTGSRREKFFDALKNKHPNLHTLYVVSSIIGIWSGAIYISDSWAHGVNLLAEPTPAFSIEVVMRHVGLLMFGLLLLLLDDLSLKELMIGRKTPSEKPTEDMSFREKIFHNFKTNYPNFSTIYTLFAIMFSWCGIWGLLYDIPMQPFWRSLMTIFIGFLLLYIDDMSLDEL